METESIENFRNAMNDRFQMNIELKNFFIFALRDIS